MTKISAKRLPYGAWAKGRTSCCRSSAPSNPRDLTGKVADYFLDPLNWWASNTDRDWVPITRALVTGIDARDQLWNVLDDLERTSVDFYAAVRSLYRQRRTDEIHNGNTGDAPLPNLTGELDLDTTNATAHSSH